MFELRDYQTAARNKIAGAFNDGIRRVLYQLPTGAGKTVIFADFIKEVSSAGLHVLVLVHRDEIMQQISQSLSGLDVAHGIIAPGYPTTADNVQVASVYSVVRRMEWLRNYCPQLIVVDEAHHSPAGTWRKIMTMHEADVLGVTATPRRLDGKPLNDLFDTLICGPSISQLIDKDWLAPVSVFTPPNSPDLSKVKIRAGDFAIDQMSSVMSRGVVITGAVNEYTRLCSGKPAIAFCVDIDHSLRVASAFSEAGWRAAHVDGGTPQRARRELIVALNEGDIDILSNCGLISEGLDVPGVEAAILLRPTRSLALYLQMVGRALRPGKDLAYILDHAGNVHRHGLPTARRRWSLRGHVRQNAHSEDEGANLIRCPECGAVNNAGADKCESCGAVLHERRERAMEVTGPQLAEALDDPITSEDLFHMTYVNALRWAADDDGVMRKEDKLARVAAARGYKPGWTYYAKGQHWKHFSTAWKGRPV